MDSTTGYTAGARSGGKIVRQRRTVTARTPYDRPSTALRDPLPPNPSWISRLSGIASGAGKFISSVVFSDSSEEEDEESSSDIDGDEDVENIMEEDLVNAQQPTIQQLGSKRVIEQLLMQETFVREEGDRLIDIIKARVVDHPSVHTALEGRHTNNELTSDVNVGEMSNKAVMEARKWLEEKKLRSSSKSKETEDGTGSPVDVAKSYMQARVPWGSPAVTSSEFRSPSSVGTQLLKEGTPFPYRGGILSSSKLKRKSGSNQSWNIQDELRKVRAKATEQMLKSPSSIASLEPKLSPYALATDMLKRTAASLNADGAVRNEKSGVLPNSAIPTSVQNQTTEANQAVEETGVLRTRFLGLDETFISTQRGKPSEDTNTAPQSGIAVDDFNDQDGDLIQPSSTIGDTTTVVLGLRATLDPTGKPCIPKDVFETSIEADEIRAACPTSNGLPSSSPSSPVAVEGQPKPKPPEETESSWPIAGTPDDDLRIWNGSDGMINNENNDSDASASHNSSNTHEEAFLEDQSLVPNSNSVSSSPVYRGRERGGRGRRRGRGTRGKGKAK